MAFQLNGFDITVATLKGIQSQALSDLVAQFLSSENEPLHEDMPYEEINSVETKELCLALYSSSIYQGEGAGVVLHSATISLSFILKFSCSNKLSDMRSWSEDSSPPYKWKSRGSEFKEIPNLSSNR